jgi:hypothetical protein
MVPGCAPAKEGKHWTGSIEDEGRLFVNLRPGDPILVLCDIRSGRMRRWAPVLAAAAVLLLILIPAAVWLQYSRSEKALGELADMHVSTLASANPVDVVSSDGRTENGGADRLLPQRRAR